MSMFATVSCQKNWDSNQGRNHMPAEDWDDFFGPPVPRGQPPHGWTKGEPINFSVSQEPRGKSVPMQAWSTPTHMTLDVGSDGMNHAPS
jgi:hypothetical protein